ncbi:MAG: molybdopterin-dependent oxidoreductase, partial [Solobacterium sp.]|nr:molybdopterin-dependent oxidoreductase [Solobacterium sp.]
AFIDKYTSGWEKGKKWFEDFDADAALEVCRVPKEQIMEFIHILCTKRWGVHPDLGLYFGRHATLSVYLLDILQVITGNFLKAGANTIAHSYVNWGVYSDENTPGRWRTWKTKGFPTLSYYGAGALQECMEDPNENDRMRALFVVAGNPVRSWPDSTRLEKLFKDLDLLVVCDIAMTETAKCANYILPGTTGYERFGTTCFSGGFPFSTLTFKQKLLEVEAERRDDSKIFMDIIDAAGLLPEIPQRLFDIAKEGVKNNDRLAIIGPVNEWLKETGNEAIRIPVLFKIMGEAFADDSYSKGIFWVKFLYGDLVPEFAMALGYLPDHKHPELEANPETFPLVVRDVVFNAVDHCPSGTVIAACDGSTESMIAEHVKHADKKIHLFDETVDKFIGAITPEKEKAATTLTEEYPYLISAGTHSDEAGVNTIMRNNATNQFRQPYVFEINPEDAEDMGFTDGQWVRISTEKGSIKIPLQFTYRAARGYGKVTHHFGLADENGKVYGEGVNKLTSGENVDEIAGDAIYRYVPCRVEALKEGESYGLWSE